jgi:hypothetical protein
MNPLAVQIVEASYDGNKPQEYQTPLYPDRNCKVRYHSPTDEDVVASAAGPRRLASFVPNYGGYADQLGASYAYMQDGGPATKLTAAPDARGNADLERPQKQERRCRKLL